MRNRNLKWAALIVAALAVAGCRPLVPVNNVTDASFGSSLYSTANVLSLDDYERAISRAGADRGWAFTRIAPGQLEGTLDVRGKHEATVDVVFNTETYSISYKSSQNLKYHAPSNLIHPNYNNWIDLLDRDIQAEIQKLRAS